MKILGIDFGSLFGADPVKHNAREFAQFDRGNPKPDYFFAYRVDYQRADGARGTVGIYSHDIVQARDLFRAEFGDSALIDGISYVDPDHINLGHWLGDEYGQAPVQAHSGEGMRSSGPDLKDDTGYARSNLRAFRDFSARNPDPDYYFCYQVNYRMPGGASGVIGIDTRDAEEAFALFTRRFGTRVLVTAVAHIDFDHNGLGANNWIEP